MSEITDSVFRYVTKSTTECTLGANYSEEANAPIDGKSFTGVANIPSTVKYAGHTYTVIAINRYAFRGCVNMTGINLPNTIREIGWDHCYDTSIKHYFIPKSVTTLKYSAFSHMNNLILITFEEGSQITDVGRGVFGSLPELRMIVLSSGFNPGTVKGIFVRTIKLQYVVYCGSNDLSSLIEPLTDSNPNVQVIVTENYPKDATFGGHEVIVKPGFCFVDFKLPIHPRTFYCKNTQKINTLILMIIIIFNKNE